MISKFGEEIHRQKRLKLLQRNLPQRQHHHHGQPQDLPQRRPGARWSRRCRQGRPSRNGAGRGGTRQRTCRGCGRGCCCCGGRRAPAVALRLLLRGVPDAADEQRLPGGPAAGGLHAPADGHRAGGVPHGSAALRQGVRHPRQGGRQVAGEVDPVPRGGEPPLPGGAGHPGHTLLQQGPRLRAPPRHRGIPDHGPGGGRCCRTRAAATTTTAPPTPGRTPQTLPAVQVRGALLLLRQPFRCSAKAWPVRGLPQGHCPRRPVRLPEGEPLQAVGAKGQVLPGHAEVRDGCEVLPTGCAGAQGVGTQ